jgi:predicted nucleic acid-binding protein
MSFLLDTCVLSETARPKPTRKVVDWLASQDERQLYLSVLTLGELRKGIAKLPSGDKKHRLAAWVDSALVERFEGRVLPVDIRVASAWGEMSGTCERAGRPLPVIDGLIAATARVHGFTVVTRNSTHFADCDTPTVDPWSGS